MNCWHMLKKCLAHCKKTIDVNCANTSIRGKKHFGFDLANIQTRS